MTHRTRVLIVDDSEDILYLYRRLINSQPDMECVATLESTVGLEACAQEHHAEVAVVVRYEDGREGRVAKRVGLGDLPKVVVDELSKRAVTRVYRPGSFSWER